MCAPIEIFELGLEDSREEYEAIHAGRALFEPESPAYEGKLLFEAHHSDTRRDRDRKTTR
jgi:hypothetical protein